MVEHHVASIARDVARDHFARKGFDAWTHEQGDRCTLTLYRGGRVAMSFRVEKNAQGCPVISLQHLQRVVRAYADGNPPRNGWTGENESELREPLQMAQRREAERQFRSATNFARVSPENKF